MAFFPVFLAVLALEAFFEAAFLRAAFFLPAFLAGAFFFETVFLALVLAIIHPFSTKRSGNMVSNRLSVKG